eukprot:6191584-Pleurochrysis_carterae.AAC.5
MPRQRSRVAWPSAVERARSNLSGQKTACSQRSSVRYWRHYETRAAGCLRSRGEGGLGDGRIGTRAVCNSRASLRPQEEVVLWPVAAVFAVGEVPQVNVAQHLLHDGGRPVAADAQRPARRALELL